MDANIPGTPGSSPTPFDFLQYALKTIPTQTKFVLGGVLVFAGASLVLSWIREFSFGLTVSVVFSLLLVGLLTSALSATSRRAKSGVGSFLSWALAILFVALLLLMITSVFFGVPPAGAAIMSRLLGSVEILTRLQSSQPQISVPAGERRSLGSLPRQIRNEPVGADQASRIQDLASYPPLEILGTLELASASEKRVLAVSTLRFSAGSIVTNGADLTIETNNLISDAGVIRAFENLEKAPARAAGQNAGRVVIIVHGQISGRLSVDLRGQSGADGSSGAAGAKGPKGAGGANAASGLFDCQRGAEAGHKGGTGQPGKDGQSGFAGGDGGVLIVYASNVAAVQRVFGEPAVGGGIGGSGGVGGSGGAGGDGGDGGSPVGLCSGGGPNGAAGDQGPLGAPGKAGSNGKPGSFRFDKPQTS
jgi:hypothetical protein